MIMTVIVMMCTLFKLKLNRFLNIETFQHASLVFVTIERKFVSFSLGQYRLLVQLHNPEKSDQPDDSDYSSSPSRPTILHDICCSNLVVLRLNEVFRYPANVRHHRENGDEV